MTRKTKPGDPHDLPRAGCSVRDVHRLAVLGILLAASLARAEIRLSSMPYPFYCIGGSHHGETCNFSVPSDCPGGECRICGITPGHRPGIYRITSTGGVLTVDGLPALPFPSGGTMTLDVHLPDPNCVAQANVPYPGGFSAPAFCIPALGFTTSVVQTGCGIGAIDTDGGSDFTITEVGDTSSPTVCSLPASGCPAPPGDSNGEVDITVGDGTADTCSIGGTGNAIVSVPVFTTTWYRFGQCPDTDGTYHPGTDTLVVSFPQILDFTTDTTTTMWADLDPDGCYLSGAGPAGIGPTAGTCIDLDAQTVAVAAGGPAFSSGSPLFDLSFLTVHEATYEWLAPSGGASCAAPPIITHGGTATRCIP
jgi:hypothetical protein